MKETKVNFDFYFGDTLARTIIEKFRWTRLKTVFVFLAFSITLSIVGALITGSALPQENNGFTELLEDGTYWISEIGAIVLLSIYYLYMYDAPNKILDQLQSRKIINIDDEIEEAAKKILKIRWMPIACLIPAGLVAWLYFYSIGFNNPASSWLNVSLTFLAVRSILIEIPFSYMAFVIVFRMIVYAVFFRMALVNVNLHPLHPDGAGGLRPLGQYALTTTWGLAIAGSLIALMEYEAFIEGSEIPYWAHFMMILYVVLAPTVFFLPLSAAHSSMKKAKEDLMYNISMQFNTDFLGAYREISGDASSLNDNLEKISQLERLHRVAANFPVWPFSVQTLRTFLVSALSPVFTILVSLASDVLIPFMKEKIVELLHG